MKFFAKIFAAAALALGAATSAAADDKADALQNLLRAYGAEGGDISALLQAQGDFSATLSALAMEGLGGGDLPHFGESGVWVVEFSDYQCGFCRRMFPLLQQSAQAGEARVRLVEFPILGELSRRAARLALAAKMQGKFAQMHFALMRGGRLTEESLQNAIKESGVDEARLLQDANSAAIDEALERNFQLARLLKVSATPTFVVGGVVAPGALREADFRRLLAGAQ